MAYSQISIRLGGLVVELGSEATYPDMVSDLTNRCLSTFKDAMDKATEHGIDVSNMRLITTELADDDYEDQSNHTWYWAVVLPLIGSTKCKRCDGLPLAAIESRA